MSGGAKANKRANTGAHEKRVRPSLSHLTQRDRELLDRIRDAIREIEPDARVILYGSRARGDAGPESDWDILIVLDGPVDREREHTLTHRLYRLELESDAVITAMVYSRQDWSSALYEAMPFHENVTREGIRL